MANTFNGVGTTFYGKRKFEPDGSYVTTKWFVVGFFPIFPMGSLRVSSPETSGIPFLARTTTYDVLEELPIDWMQVLWTYVYTIFILAWIGYFLSREMNGIAKFAMITAGIVLPHVLRWFSKPRAG